MLALIGMIYFALTGRSPEDRLTTEIAAAEADIAELAAKAADLYVGA
ncbi:hypothetical protein [Jannaschia seohaensis]|uniref:Uncharacterized protein n=1 Tax=Jannaschia seohaensis TaxID=475081 RepID=A0A2Y9BAH6_9RHOB|nr:hypothetical protein [Jannaschia seohaensis]PWJ12146.1 hypothetical protein BCF38_11781 [Jannaschia seohaensis]SSA51249.1 hypothetical protein SAMN05421539_11781 [Jannaschia seohaensis]